VSIALTVSIRRHHGLKSSENYGSGILSLGRDLVEFSEPGKSFHGFKIPPHEITGFTFAGRLRGDDPDCHNTNYTPTSATRPTPGRT